MSEGFFMNVKKQVIILFFLGFFSSSVVFATQDCGLLSLLRKIFSSKRSRLNRVAQSRETVVLDLQYESYERISIPDGEEEIRMPVEEHDWKAFHDRISPLQDEDWDLQQHERISIPDGEEEERVLVEEVHDWRTYHDEIDQLHDDNLEILRGIDTFMDVLKAQQGV